MSVITVSQSHYDELFRLYDRITHFNDDTTDAEYDVVTFRIDHILIMGEGFPRALMGGDWSWLVRTYNTFVVYTQGGDFGYEFYEVKPR